MNMQEQKLEDLLRGRGLGWAIDLFAPREGAAAHYLRSLSELERYLQERRLGTTTFSPEALEQLAAVSPHKADAFLQALVSIRGTPFLCAAWRVLQGMEIDRVEMRYARLAEFSLQLTLRSPYDETEQYETRDISDVVFVRHLGKSTINGKPLFDGFYPLRQT